MTDKGDVRIQSPRAQSTKVPRFCVSRSFDGRRFSALSENKENVPPGAKGVARSNSLRVQNVEAKVPEAKVVMDKIGKFDRSGQCLQTFI